MSDKMREALEQCLSVLSLGHQVGPYAYAGENMDRHMKDAAALAKAALAEQRGEVAGWLTDQGTFHFDKTDAWNDSEGFIEPLYAAPPAPAVPDDVAKDAARYRWMVEHCADVSRHQGNGKWCCQWFDHQGKGAALHCTEWHETAAQAVDAAMLAAAPTAAAPAPVVPEGWREFIAECATFAGKMVNGNRLSERAAGLLADAPEVPRG